MSLSTPIPQDFEGEPPPLFTDGMFEEGVEGVEEQHVNASYMKGEGEEIEGVHTADMERKGGQLQGRAATQSEEAAVFMGGACPENSMGIRISTSLNSIETDVTNAGRQEVLTPRNRTTPRRSCGGPKVWMEEKVFGEDPHGGKRPCSTCRKSKVRCDRGFPCTRCVRLGLDCREQARVRRGGLSRSHGGRPHSANSSVTSGGSVHRASSACSMDSLNQAGKEVIMPPSVSSSSPSSQGQRRRADALGKRGGGRGRGRSREIVRPLHVNNMASHPVAGHTVHPGLSEPQAGQGTRAPFPSSHLPTLSDPALLCADAALDAGASFYGLGSGQEGDDCSMSQGASGNHPTRRSFLLNPDGPSLPLQHPHQASQYHSKRPRQQQNQEEQTHVPYHALKQPAQLHFSPGLRPAPHHQLPAHASATYLVSPTQTVMESFLKLHAQSRICRGKSLAVMRSWALAYSKGLGAAALGDRLSVLSAALGIDWKTALTDPATVEEAARATTGSTAPEAVVAFEPAHLDPFLRALYTDASAAAALVACQGHTQLLGNALFSRDFIDPASCNAAWVQVRERQQEAGTDPMDILGGLLSREDQGEFFHSVGAMLFSNPRPCAEMAHIARVLTRQRESILALVRVRFHLADGGGYSAFVLSFQRLPCSSRYILPSAAVTPSVSTHSAGQGPARTASNGSTSISSCTTGSNSGSAGGGGGMRRGASTSSNSSSTSDGLNLQGNAEGQGEDDDTSASARSTTSSDFSSFSSHHRDQQQHPRHSQPPIRQQDEVEGQKRPRHLSPPFLVHGANASAAAMAGRVSGSYPGSGEAGEGKATLSPSNTVYGGAQQVKGGEVSVLHSNNGHRHAQNPEGIEKEQLSQPSWLRGVEDTWWVSAGPHDLERAPAGLPTLEAGEGMPHGMGTDAKIIPTATDAGGGEGQHGGGGEGPLESALTDAFAGENARATERDEMLHFLEEYF